MELDSPPLQGDEPISPRDWIVQRLIQRGILPEKVHHLQRGLVAAVKENKQLLPEIILAILPTYEEVCDAKVTLKSVFGTLTPKDLYAESLSWLQWLMFKDDPQVALKILAGQSLGQRSVCGSIWGAKDLAYRCKTCENDPTCAICVPCFENGNHKDHDYSIMYTGGGCCDCGDITAWKREGFCSKHKGAEMIQPLSLEVADSIAPVLDVLFVHWKNALFALDEKTQGHLDENNYTNVCRNVVNEFSSVIIEILLDFCNCSESLLSFISKKVTQTLDLLELLLRSETFLDVDVVKMLHELLLKFLAEPLFKHEFAKVFATYYSYIFHEMIHKYNDKAMEKYPLVQTFSVQIFTVPTLAPVLVREMNLLDVLLDCLGEIFQSCLEVDGYVQATKWSKLHMITIRLIEDTRYVVSHKEIQMYVARERPDIFKTLLSLLALIQGMDPQKRITGLHIEEENENLHEPFNLEHYLGKINNLLVEGAFSLHEPEKASPKLNNGTQLQVANFEKNPPEELCFCSGSENDMINLAVLPSNSISEHNIDYIPPSVTFLIVECLKAIEKWLGPVAMKKQTNSSVLDDLRSTCYEISNLRKRLFRSKNDRSGTVAYRRPVHCVDSSRSTLPIHYDSSEATSTSVTVGDSDNSIETAGKEELQREADYDQSSSIMTSNNSHVSSSNNMGALSLTEWPEIMYDVSSQEISFRIPLHRFLTLLLCKLMKSCFGEAANTNAISDISCLPLLKCNFFGHILVGFHPYGVSAFLMEHPLRLRVFCAQVRAGMWRRNGESVIFMSEWYHNENWSDIGIETDLFLLQCCAALAPSELFVNRVLERFGLSNYLSLNVAEYKQSEPILVQEMLCLIIQIVTERRFCGFSSIENLQREVIQRLAVGNATHSQLVKFLPRDLSKNKQLKNIVDKVALYQSPSSMEQGKYSLRKTFWKELDLYHPRWNLSDLQIAEERFLQASKISPLNVQLPKWRKIFDPFRTIHRIATSKKVLEIIRAVLFYSVFTETPALSRAPDGVLVTALHLLSLALDICDKYMHLNDEADYNIDMPCSSQQSDAAIDLFPVLMLAPENIDTGMDNASLAWKHQSILSLLVSLLRKHRKENDHDHSDSKLCSISSLIEALLKKFAQLNTDCMSELKKLAPDVICPTKSSCRGAELDRSSASDDRKAKARERQAAILEKMRSAQSKFMASNKFIDSSDLDTSTRTKGRSHEELGPVCSLCRDTNSDVPLSLLILVQKSRLSTLVDRGPLTWEDPCDSKEQFVVSGEGSSNTTISDTRSLSSDTLSHFNMPPTEIDTLLDAVIALNTTKVQSGISSCKERDVNIHLSLEKMEIDIYQLVQDDILNTVDAPVACQGQLFAFDMDSLKHFQNSEPPADGNLSNKFSKQPLPSSQSFHSKTSLRISAPVSFSDFGPVDCDGVHISSCGHAVHQECHDRYLSSLRQRHLRRLELEGGDFVELALGELLCPVCRRLANSTLPLISGDPGKNWRRKISPDDTLSCFGSSSTICKLDDTSELLPRALSILRCTSKALVQFPFPKYFSGVRSEATESASEPFLHKLSAIYCPGKPDKWRAASKLNQSLMLWDTLRYTLVSTEIAARGSSDVYSEGYDGLFRKFHHSCYVLSVLLQASQAARNVDIFQLMLRCRGVQLFGHTICAGLLDDVSSSDAEVYRGILSSVVEQIDETSGFPSIQFLEIAAAPILAHDAFSSLMWVLFSLPFPFASSLESFIPLVHLFYIICVIQSLVTCHANHHFIIASYGLYGSCPLIAITKMMGETDFARQYFISHYLHDSPNIIHMVRKLTAPYLRRCALLWKLFELSSLSSNSSNILRENLTSSLTDHVSDTTSSDPLGHQGISELEKMFRISSMDVIFNSQTVHDLALKWWEHFCQVFVVQERGAVLYLTPAVPFQLMQLPQIYQDLLRRYIKQQCPYCQSIPKDPALCLLCGRLCSFSLKWCCRESRCQSHTASCGSGIGVYLLIRKTIILLHRSGRTAFWPSPYLDAFGEEDREMTRGKPLYLNEKRYTALTSLVASHGLDHNSEVLRMADLWVV